MGIIYWLEEAGYERLRREIERFPLKLCVHHLIAVMFLMERRLAGGIRSGVCHLCYEGE